MVQYTDNLIPVMISNTAPSGIANASSMYSAEYDAYKAFDNNNSTISCWYTNNFSTGWLQYRFSSVQKVTKYTITSRNIDSQPSLPLAAPKSWTLKGSNDGSTWTILDAQTNIINWISNETKEFYFDNQNNYLYYRIDITASNSPSQLGIGELQMMSVITTNKFLIKQNSQYYSIKPEFYDNTTTHEFTPLTLTSGNSYPNADDYNNNGFDDVSALCTSTTVGSDTFRPVDKFGETKVTGATFTTTDSKVYTVNPTTNVPFKQGSVICYSDGSVVTPDSINYTNGTVTFNTAQTGTMTFDYIYMYKFKIMMCKPN